MSRPVVACVGDSLTAGESVDGVPFTNIHSWTAKLDERLFPDVSFANLGNGGERVDQMRTRWENYYEGKGFDRLIFWGGINDVLQGRTAAAIWADMEAVIDSALADEVPVILVHTPGAATLSGWTGAMQTQLDALRVLMLAKQGVTHVDLSQPYPEGLNDPADPDALYDPIAVADNLHFNPIGEDHVADLLEAVLRPMYPEPEVDEEAEDAAVEGEDVAVFGVTPTTVKQDHFPQWTGSFSATSNPTTTTVERWIEEEAAELSGRLRLKGLAAATLAVDSDVDAFAWCRKTISLATAIRVAKVITGTNPEYAKGLQADLDRRYELLDKHGAEALGIGATVDDSTDEPEGPTSHVDDLDLDVGEDDGNESDLVPVLRRADQL